MLLLATATQSDAALLGNLLNQVGPLAVLIAALWVLKTKVYDPAMERRDRARAANAELFGDKDPATGEVRPSLRALAETQAKATEAQAKAQEAQAAATIEMKSAIASLASAVAESTKKFDVLTDTMERLDRRVSVLENTVPTLATSDDIAQMRAMWVEVRALRDEFTQANVLSARHHIENQTKGAVDQHLRQENTRSIDTRLDRLSSVLESLLAQRGFSTGNHEGVTR